MKLYFQLIFSILFFCSISSCVSESKKDNYQTITTNSIKNKQAYVGDANCISCHKNEYDSWKGSHHDLAMQIANDATVLGNFDDHKIKIDKVSYHFYKKSNEYFVNIIEIDGSKQTHKIAYTFGVTPLQQYLIDFDKGNKQVLRVTWNVLENKWYHQYKGDHIQPNDWMHWSRGAQNWNTMCAECHSTDLKKNYFVEKDSFHTTYSSINVSCESCHGPARNHIQWANSNSKDGNKNILSGLNQNEQLNLCAPCHARRVKLTNNLEPGKQFEDQYMIQSLSSNYYHGDGQIREEDYVYGSFLQSKMYHEGVKCSDCHNPHSMKLKFQGNKLCLQCHVEKDYNTEKHHFHQTNTKASLCINCHMTGETYMGNDFRRDHSFRIPRPDQSVKYGTPNACTKCHKDKTDEWAANSIIKNYGNERKEHFSDALLLSNSNNLSRLDRDKLNAFIVDLQFPAISRATVIENLNFVNDKDINTLLLSLNDSSAMVRYNAILKFRSLSMQDRVSIALKHVNDSIKLVRIGAAQLVIGFDDSSLDQINKNNLLIARGELETMLYSNADFSTGRMQLGDYYLQNRDLRTTIKHYKVALKKDSLLLPVYSNLATAYSLNKEYEKAGATLDTWIRLDSESSRPHYLKALLNFEIGENENAIKELKTAIKIDPNDTRSMYNLATYYYQNKMNLKAAENYIKNALKLDSLNQDYKYLLALIYKEQGKSKLSQKIMKELNVN